MLHQQLLLREHELTLRALENSHQQFVGVLIKVLLHQLLFVEDSFTRTLIDQSRGMRTKPGG